MNTIVEGMLQKYKPKSEQDYENALKEIIQEIALLGMWRSKFFEVGGFYGGTALRILYGLDRFSEDLDFSLLSPDPSFSLGRYEVFLRNELEAFGFRVTVKRKEKTKSSTIESAFIKANTSEHILEVAPKLMTHSRKALKIKIEVDTNPPGFEAVEVRPHFRPIPFSVKTFTLPTLFAGKIAACLFRPYKNRVKGRDWYDFLWYTSGETPFLMAHLDARVRQVESPALSEPFSLKTVQHMLHDRMDSLQFGALKEDVMPFVRDPEIVEAWTKELFHAAIDRLQAV